MLAGRLIRVAAQYSHRRPTLAATLPNSIVPHWHTSQRIGRLLITRASQVEPDSDGNWFADMGPVGGRCWAVRDAGGGVGGGEGVVAAIVGPNKR
jgi:hypothetical protein